MGCSMVAQSLDSLWFYSNILTCCRTEDSVSAPVPVALPSLTDDDQLAPPPPPPPIHAKEGDLHRPSSPLCVLNQQNESQPLGVQNLDLTPVAPPPPTHAKEGDFHRPSSPICVLNQQRESQPLGVEDLDLTPGCHEIGECPSASVSRRETEKRERKMRKKEKKKKKKKKSNFGIIDARKEILGAVELGFGVKQVCGVLNQMLTDQHEKKTHLPPFDDDVVMKQHLKSWAYAVACCVKV